jgi:hypothetical protein
LHALVKFSITEGRTYPNKTIGDKQKHKLEGCEKALTFVEFDTAKIPIGILLTGPTKHSLDLLSKM